MSSLWGAGHIASYAFPFTTKGATFEATRQELYRTLEGYYMNVVFEELGLAALEPELAASAGTDSLRGIYNPAQAIVDCYVNWTLCGLLGPETDPTAEVHVRAVNPALPAAVQQVWDWSQLETEKALVPFYAANYGDALLSVVGRPDQDGSPGKVWLEVRHPRTVVDVDYDDRGNIVYARLEERKREPRTVDSTITGFAVGSLEATEYTWTGIYTKEEFATLKDGQPFDFGPGARWPNPWGFVPLVLVRHKPSGGDWGLNAYAQVISVINELCLDASTLGQLLCEWLAPQWAIFGLGKTQKKVNRDGSAWLFEENGDAKALVANVDFSGSYEHISSMLKWLSDRQPELALSRAREANLQTGAAIRAMLFETVKVLERAQDAYDTGLIRALQMALTIAQSINPGGTALAGFAGLGRYEDGALAFRFDRPDILPVSKLEAMQAEADMAGLERQTTLQRAISPAQGQADSTQTAASLLASRLLNGVSNGQ
jgi:hypothetical protein